MPAPPIPPRLHAAIQCVIRETRGFNERTQEWWCRVCRYKDPLGTKLHDDACPIYELHGAWEEALKPIEEVTARVERLGKSTVSDPTKLLPGMPIRCECGGPVAVLSTPPRNSVAFGWCRVSYGWCLACQYAVIVTEQPLSAGAVDPSAPDPGTPATREKA